LKIAENSRVNIPAPAKSIYDYCLLLLTRREHGRKELITKCQSKGFVIDDILPILDELAQRGYQSDDRYAESLSRHRIKRGYGAVAIRYELQQNGISEFDIDSVLLELADSWQAVLEQIYYKKFSDDRYLTAHEWAKRSRFLQQRGFSPTLINTLARQLHITF
jgi:regulatory protein